MVNHLTFIINQTLRTSPITKVRSLYKKGDKQAINNYRPIYIMPYEKNYTCTISKLF